MNLNNTYYKAPDCEVISAQVCEITAEKKELKSKSLSTGLAALISIGLFTFFATVVVLVTSLILKNSMFLTNTNLDLLPDMLINGVISLVFIGGFAVVFGKIIKADFSEILPFEKTSAKKIAGIVAIGLAVSFSANYITEIFMMDFRLFGLDPTISTTLADSNSILEHIVYILSVSVVPAVSEELLFRGIIMGRLRKFGDGFAILASSVLFGLMHGNFVQIPFAFVVGLVLGWSLAKTNNFLVPMLIHFGNNFMSVVTDILMDIFEANNISIEFLNILYIILIAFVFALAIITTVKLSKTSPDYLKIKPYKGSLSFKDRVSAFFLSPTVIIFNIYCIFNAVSTLAIINVSKWIDMIL